MANRFFSPREQITDANGDPVPGAKLYFYETGTTTPKTTYSDSALTTPNANPVVAGDDGFVGAIFFAAGDYKLVVKTAADVTLGTYDPVGGIGTNAVLATGSSVARTPEARWAEILNVKDFGAKGDGATDDTAAVIATIAAATGDAIVFFPPSASSYRFATGNIALPSDKRLTLHGCGTVATVATTNPVFTISVGNDPVNSPRHQIHGFDFTASTLGEGVGIKITDSSHILIEACRFFKLEKGVQFVATTGASGWCESHVLRFCEFRGCSKATAYENPNGAATRSFASHTYHNVIIATALGSGGEFGLHIGTGCSLYRSNFNPLVIFPSTTNSTAVYCNGILRNVSGLLSIEGPSVLGVGIKGMHFGANAIDCETSLHLDIRGQLNTFFQFDANTAIVGLKTNNTFQGGRMVRNGVAQTVDQWVSADDFSTVFWMMRLRSDGFPYFQGRPATWPHFVDKDAVTKLLPLSALLVTGTQTASSVKATNNDTTPSVLGANAIYFESSGATSVTTFDDGVAGQILIVRHRNTNTTLVHGATLALQGSINYAAATGAMHIFWLDGTVWREISRVVP